MAGDKWNRKGTLSTYGTRGDDRNARDGILDRRLAMSTCVTCTFYNRRDEGGGHCRRYPPQIMFQGFASGGGQSAQYFPFMSPDEWCGEHKDTRTYHAKQK